MRNSLNFYNFLINLKNNLLQVETQRDILDWVKSCSFNTRQKISLLLPDTQVQVSSVKKQTILILLSSLHFLKFCSLIEISLPNQK